MDTEPSTVMPSDEFELETLIYRLAQSRSSQPATTVAASVGVPTTFFDDALRAADGQSSNLPFRVGIAVVLVVSAMLWHWLLAL